MTRPPFSSPAILRGGRVIHDHPLTTRGRSWFIPVWPANSESAGCPNDRYWQAGRTKGADGSCKRDIHEYSHKYLLKNSFLYLFHSFVRWNTSSFSAKAGKKPFTTALLCCIIIHINRIKIIRSKGVDVMSPLYHLELRRSRWCFAGSVIVLLNNTFEKKKE